VALALEFVNGQQGKKVTEKAVIIDCPLWPRHGNREKILAEKTTINLAVCCSEMSPTMAFAWNDSDEVAKIYKKSTINQLVSVAQMQQQGKGSTKRLQSTGFC